MKIDSVIVCLLATLRMRSFNCALGFDSSVFTLRPPSRYVANKLPTYAAYHSRRPESAFRLHFVLLAPSDSYPSPVVTFCSCSVAATAQSV